MTSPSSPQTRKVLPSAYRWELLVILFLAYFFHQSDRAIYGVVAKSIQDEFNISTELLLRTRTYMFTIMALIVPLAGFVGDKFNKRKLLISCLFCWSVATICTGCVSGVWGMIIFNSVGVSVAEAFYGPAATSLIASYHKETRSIALSVHQTAVYLSVIFIGAVGGWISERLDWRHAFWILGGVSIAVGVLLIFRLKDPAKYQIEGDSETETTSKTSEKVNVVDFLKMIFANPSALLLTVGFTAIVFVNNAFLNIVSLFLQGKFDLKPTAAGWNGMFWHHIAAFAFIYVGGFLSDKASKRYPSFRPKQQFIAMALGVPIVFMIGRASSLAAVYALFFAMGVCRGFYECNTHASVFETIPTKYRSTTVGFMIMFAFIIGAWSAQIVGALVDKYGVDRGYELGFAMLSGAWVVGAICVGVAAFFTFDKDRAKRIAAEEEPPRLSV